MNTSRKDFIKALFAVGAVASVPAIAKAALGDGKKWGIDYGKGSETFYGVYGTSSKSIFMNYRYGNYYIDTFRKIGVKTTYQYQAYKCDGNDSKMIDESVKFENYTDAIRHAASEVNRLKALHDESGNDVVAIIVVEEIDSNGITDFDLFPIALNGSIDECKEFDTPRGESMRMNIKMELKERSV